MEAARVVALIALVCLPLSVLAQGNSEWNSVIWQDPPGFNPTASFIPDVRAMACDDTVFTELQRDESMKLLVKAIQETGLRESLEGPGPVTIFAPSDSAFMELSTNPATRGVLDMDLRQLMQYHISGDNVDIAEDQAMVANGGMISNTVMSTTGQPISIQVTSFTTSLNNDATVLGTTPTCNGQIVRTNRVLLPPQTNSFMDPPVMTAPELDLLNQPNSFCGPNECCDLEPQEFSCKEQVEWGKCSEDWLISGNFCRKSCGFCFSSPDGSAPPATAIIPRGDQNSPNFLGDGFDPMSAYVREGLLYQQWVDIKGSKMTNMLESSQLLEKPDVTEILTGTTESFSGPAGYSSRRNTASRMAGFFCPPLSGDYKFYLTSDDDGVLYIADGPADHKRRLARIDGYKRKSEWKGSEVINLKKGRPYFLEALQKQGEGNGHLKVGVKFPSGAVLRPITSDFFSMSCLDTPSVADLPTPSLEEACRCTDDGYSGPTEQRVNTGTQGCFNYNFRDDMISGAQRAGEAIGSGFGEYFVNRWGADPSTVSNLASYWGNLASSAAVRDEGTEVRICYVKYPEFCPTSLPSRDIRGAAWRRC